MLLFTLKLSWALNQQNGQQNKLILLLLLIPGPSIKLDLPEGRLKSEKELEVLLVFPPKCPWLSLPPTRAQKPDERTLHICQGSNHWLWTHSSWKHAYCRFITSCLCVHQTRSPITTWRLWVLQKYKMLDQFCTQVRLTAFCNFSTSSSGSYSKRVHQRQEDNFLFITSTVYIIKTLLFFWNTFSKHDPFQIPTENLMSTAKKFHNPLRHDAGWPWCPLKTWILALK